MGILDLFLEVVGGLCLLVLVAVLGDKYGAAGVVTSALTKGPASKSGVAA